jgi:hypothetical protein
MPTDWAKRMPKLAVKPLIGRIDAWEDKVLAMPEAHQAVQDTPVRFEIMKEKMKRDGEMDPAVAPLMPAMMLGVRKSMLSLRRNPP